MGWSYRKSVSIGPFRVNINKSGVGYSVGGKGFRTGVRANGSVFQSFGIPGTGLRYTSSRGGKSSGSGGGCCGCVVFFIVAYAIIKVIF
jgi:hypothetical protein